MTTYTTKQGDAFDMIAKCAYGREALMTHIMRANPAHLDVAVFGAGVVLAIPDVAAEQYISNTAPPWRDGT